jgi:hypothetical protein
LTLSSSETREGPAFSSRGTAEERERFFQADRNSGDAGRSQGESDSVSTSVCLGLPWMDHVSSGRSLSLFLGGVLSLLLGEFLLRTGSLDRSLGREGDLLLGEFLLRTGSLDRSLGREGALLLGESLSLQELPLCSREEFWYWVSLSLERFSYE